MVVVATNTSDEKVRTTAEEIARQLEAAGFDVLLDDRDERPGVKFKDADLVGIPFRINVGKKVTEDMVEVVRRSTLAREDIKISAISEYLLRLVRLVRGLVQLASTWASAVRRPMETDSNRRANLMATLKLVLGFGVFLAMILVGIKVIPPFFSNYEFEDAIKAEALQSTYSSRSEEDIRKAVMKHAREYDIP